MTNIPEGYGFVAGRSRETAKAILAAAEAAGVDRALVQTVADGYLAPETAVRQYEGKGADEGEGIEPDEFEQEEPEPEPDEKVELSREGRPDQSWKNADIKEWARNNGVDLGDATNKADLLAAISTADTKEE